MSNPLQPHGLQHARLPWTSWNLLFIFNKELPISWNLLKLMSTESLMPPPINPSVSFSSCLQSFPASGSFPISWLCTSGGQSIGASVSASVLPMNIQGWFPLELSGLVSLLSKGLSRVFSSTTVQNHQFSNTQASLWFPHICTRLLENHSFDWMDLCLQSDVSVF